MNQTHVARVAKTMHFRPQTIQIFLPSGDPRGIRVAEITTRIVQAIDVPRSRVADFLEMRESERLSLYVLVGEADDGSGKLAYIGQSGDLRKRLAAHNNEKDFWQRALVLSTRTESLTQTHALFLENLLIQETRNAGRYRTDNCNSGIKQYVPAPLVADCHEIFDTGRTLVASLGVPLFERLGNGESVEQAQDLLFCRRSNTAASGYYTDEGFVVLRGSIGKAEIGKGFQNHSFSRLRDDLLQQQKISIQDGVLVFDQDVLFTSPSGASAVVCGTACNGWLDWKDQHGTTLHELKRRDEIEQTTRILKAAA
ncbi:putative GIY-YIG superfamily endonuclease [Paraburkholderia sp. JPY158]|uniref:Putative GIY-YIG superfamily endonuclease n=1 Tax=Paraburkholderia atlantica TaxID=2654982 RepID=A0A7W8Q3J8_PARAM|nr:GIY-YIG nuclease family protein [Paraburkholderia atlantica]MBB5422640.1 putative GIY-YIG superfamily endonuclease [Paraburkholderia atlantica]